MHGSIETLIKFRYLILQQEDNI